LKGCLIRRFREIFVWFWLNRSPYSEAKRPDS
jgi:hypothetical protein